MNKYDFDGNNTTELPIADELTLDEIKGYIRYYSHRDDTLSNYKRSYFKSLLNYKRMQEKVFLSNKIKRKLKVKYASGYYQKEDIGAVLDISPARVKRIEEKVTRVLKHPKNSKHLRDYSGDYEWKN